MTVMARGTGWEVCRADGGVLVSVERHGGGATFDTLLPAEFTETDLASHESAMVFEASRPSERRRVVQAFAAEWMG